MKKSIKNDKEKKLKALLIFEALIVAALITLFIVVYFGQKDRSQEEAVTEGLVEPDSLITSSLSERLNEESEASETNAEETEATPQDAAKDFDIVMSFAGDCCMASNLSDTSYGSLLWYEQNYPTTYFFDGVRDYFENDDFTVVNCENTFSDKDIPPRDKGDEIAYWFKAPARFAKVFSDNSIEAVTISNNHTNDYGPEVFEDTKTALDEAGVEWGFKDKIIYYEKEGFKIAVVCVSYYYYDDAVANALPYLLQANENSDFQIVFFHGGVEGTFQEEQWKIDACHMMVDNGADLILGAHPHVLQRREKYNGVDIVYSLGNFCFGGNNHPSSNRTIIYRYTLHLHDDSATDGIEVISKDEEIIPCYVYTGSINNWQPAPIDDEETRTRVLSYMNGELDLPN